MLAWRLLGWGGVAAFAVGLTVLAMGGQLRRVGEG